MTGRRAHSLNVHHDAHTHGHHVDAAPADGAIKDPVCRMTVDPHATPHQTTHAATNYFFCSSRCRTKFDADPARYLAAETVTANESAVPAGTIYICPMHPQVRRLCPGSCPI